MSALVLLVISNLLRSDFLGSLTILNADATDSGGYTCKATNRIEDHSLYSKEIAVKVLSKIYTQIDCQYYRPIKPSDFTQKFVIIRFILCAF